MKDGSGNLLKTTGSYNSYTNIIELLHRGKPNIPLYAGFTDSDTILNDGVTPNKLVLYITNTNRSVDLNSELILSKDSRFIISFETGGITKKWALVEPDQAQNIQINNHPLDNKDWQIQAPSKSPIEWIVQPQLKDNGQPKKESLKADEEIQLAITNIVSSHPTGEGNMYIRYENIPDYANGTLIVPIQKTPLLYRGNSVGVYTIPRLGYAFKDFDSGENKGISLDVQFKETQDKDTGLSKYSLNLKNITILAPGSVKFKYPSRDILLDRGIVGNDYLFKFSWKAKNQPNPKVVFEKTINKICYGGNTNLGCDDLASDTYDFTWELQQQKKLIDDGYSYTRFGSKPENQFFLASLEITGIYKAQKEQDHPPRVYLFSSDTYLSHSQEKKELVLYTESKERALIDQKGNLVIKERIKDKTGLVMPVGTILYYAGNRDKPPEGWLFCDGKVHKKDDYQDLFDVIRYKYLTTLDLGEQVFQVPLLKIPTDFLQIPTNQESIVGQQTMGVIMSQRLSWEFQSEMTSNKKKSLIEKQPVFIIKY